MSYFTSGDMLEMIKIAIILIIGYIIIKALLSLGPDPVDKDICKCVCDQLNSSIIYLG